MAQIFFQIDTPQCGELLLAKLLKEVCPVLFIDLWLCFQSYWLALNHATKFCVAVGLLIFGKSFFFQNVGYSITLNHVLY